MRTIGHAGPLVTATTGIEIPLQPRALTQEQEQARTQRQIAVIEAAADRAAAPPPVKPARHRVRTSAVPGSATPAAPASGPADSDPSGDVWGPQAVLAAAGQRINQLMEQRDAQLQVLTARAEAAERALAAAQQRIQLLAADLVAALADSTGAEQDGQDDGQHSDGVMCEGGCGIPVAPGYTARTGARRHGCCPDQGSQQAGVSAHPAQLTANGDPAGSAGSERRAAA